MQDCDFHPSQPLLATGLIDGKLLLHGYDKQGVSPKESIKGHSASCRAVRFALNGDLLISASADQSLLAVDLETGKALARKKEAHSNAINRLAALGPALTASGATSAVSRENISILVQAPGAQSTRDIRSYTWLHSGCRWF